MADNNGEATTGRSIIAALDAGGRAALPTTVDLEGESLLGIGLVERGAAAATSTAVERMCGTLLSATLPLATPTLPPLPVFMPPTVLPVVSLTL